jgi:hypothetical protein
VESSTGRLWWKDYAITFAVAYIAVTLVGTLAIRLQAELISRMVPELASRLVALLVVMLLVSLYAVTTAPGRRSHWSVYLLAGITCPLAIFLLATLAFVIPAPYEAWAIVDALVTGFTVGVSMTGSSDPATGSIVFMTTFLLWWLGIATAVLIPVAVRGALYKGGAD